MTQISSQKITLQHIANLILPPLMWAASSVPMITDYGRGPQELSEFSDTLLVPFGAAFSIWFPIFVGCIAYGVVQILPKNRARPLFVDIGQMTALAFLGVMLWGLFSAFMPSVEIARWATAIVFVPTVMVSCAAAVMATRRANEFIGAERYYILWPLCWLAGWCSIAVFLNWAQLGVHDVIGFGMSELVVCLMTLAAALGWAVIILRRTGGNYAYLFPIVWGLGFLVLARTSDDMPSQPIAIAAGIGALILIATAYLLRRQNKLA